MGGVVGRVFHEFGVTISMTILISGIVSLTLTPMLCSRLLRPDRQGERRGGCSGRRRPCSTRPYRGYGATLRASSPVRASGSSSPSLTIVATLYLYRVVPKGFFPVEDTGLIFASTEGPQDVSFAAMVARQKAVADIVQHDPDVDYVMSTVGAGGLSNTTNSGRMFIALKPRDQRKLSSDEVIQRLRREVGAGARDQQLLPERPEPEDRRPAVEEPVSVHDPGPRLRPGRALCARSWSARSAA